MPHVGSAVSAHAAGGHASVTSITAPRASTPEVEPVTSTVSLVERPLAPARPGPLRHGHGTAGIARYRALLVSGDVAGAAVAWLATTQLGQLLGLGVLPTWGLVLLAVWWVGVLTANRGYQSFRLGVGSDELRSVFRAAAHTLIGAAVLGALLQSSLVLTGVLVATAAATVLALLTRLALRRWLHAARRHGHYLQDTLVVGSLAHVSDLADRLLSEPDAGMRVVGYCVPPHEVAQAREAGLTVLGDTEHVRTVVMALGVPRVAVASGQSPSYLRELAWSLENLDTHLLVHPGVVEVAGPRMHLRPMIGLPLLQIEQPHFSGWRPVAKRATDIVLSAFGLLVGAPLMLGIALAIRLSDGGPAFFRQVRVGRNGRTFTMLKFRSMHVDAEAMLARLKAENEGAGPLFKMAADPRITPVGRLLRRTSLDELPQLINVLLGTMSLVGPRPPLPSEVTEYERDVRRRLLVVPGLTGLWQVSGRSALSWEDSVRLDLRYVENWSLGSDLLILWKTAFAVLARHGAY
ncbi:sugar transferase [Desertihabitans brevis]|uniref:Sugar transferase n=1 Tax=Desertihabitans brevis TaxID=2268447 RepID=A0A367YQA5_9ACTN|nr:sugar transferase [Desertihabitans brevis]RCK67960.1 sugar transferase [Desertihabitans brevis]